MAKRPIGSRAIALGALAVLAAACAPYFAGGSTLTAASPGPVSPLVTISWSAATEDDDGQEVASYAVEVNGVVRATLPATSRSCVLTGLAASTTYTVAVTATDTAGEWSGDIGGDAASLGRLTTQVVTPPGGGAGPSIGCVSPTDTDGDRLPDAVETGTGTYLHAAATGTSPTNADTDGDAIRDGDEVLGTTAGLDLRAMGARPTKKNLIFEFDWFNDNADPAVCGAHSHRPTAGAIAKVVGAFAAAPVANPDGTSGITVIADYGQGGAFTGGNLVPDTDGVIAGGVSNSDFTAIKATHFAANRSGYVHYVLMPHRYGTTSNSSGQAELFGDDMIVSLQCYLSDRNVGNTIVHEVGHNLGLRHGGNVDTNDKPNYNSVMNYRYQFDGVDTNCTPPGDGRLDYSRGTNASLNESSLLETNGICGGVDWDWDGDGGIDAAAVSVDINGDTAKSVLTDSNDWAAIVFTGITDSDGAGRSEPEVITEQPVPHDHQH